MFTLNGIGTKLYGRDEVSLDDSYIATKWFVLIFFPIFPITSYRVTRGFSKSWGLPIIFPGSSTEYYMEEIPMNWKQVIKIYLFTYGTVLIAGFELVNFQTYFVLSLALTYWLGKQLYILYKNGERRTFYISIFLSLIILMLVIQMILIS